MTSITEPNVRGGSTTTSPPSAPSARLTGQQRWVLLLCAAASFLPALDTLVVSTALSSLRAGLGASLDQLEWVANSYILAIAALMMAASSLGERFGRRRLFVAGTVVFAAASAECALAPGIGALILGRAVQGTGAALMMPLALAILTDAFPAQRRGWVLGIFSSVIGFSMISGPVVGGVIVAGLSWHWIFWVNVPLGLAIAILAVRRLPAGRRTDRSVDVPGIVLITLAGLGLVWGAVRSSAGGWGSAEVLVALGAGLALTVGFVVRERTAAHPMLPLALFRSGVFTAGNVSMVCLQGALAGSLFGMAQFLQDGLGHDPLGAGLRLAPWGAVTFLVPQVAGRLIDRFGPRVFTTVGLGVFGACMVWIAVLARPGLSYGWLVAPLLLAGAGFAIAAPAAQAAVLGSVPPASTGAAAGTMSTLRQFGGAFGIAVPASAFTAFGGYATPDSFSHGFTAAMIVSGAIALVGALAGLALRPQGRG